MKSLQQGEKQTLTSCKDCVLAIYEGKAQTSCLANRIDKINHIEAYDEEKEFFVMERFCNYYRNNKEVYVQDEVVDIDRIKNESKITFDIIVLCNHIDYEYFKYILGLYYHLFSNYNKDKFIFHLMYTVANKEQKDLIKKLHQEIQNSYVTFYRDDLFLHNTISKTNKSYHIVIDKDKKPSVDFASKLNNLVNEEMKKVVTYVDNGIFVIANLAYKITSYQEQSYVYTDIVHKIIDQSKQLELYYE